MEGDAGARQLNPTQTDETPDESVAVIDEHHDDLTESPEHPADATLGARRPERLGRGWLAAICAGLLLLAGGAAAGGYLALRSHSQSQALARDEATAIASAKDCVAATQAPDTSAMSASQAKIVECTTGDFGTQAALYGGVLADAYKAANVTVQVSDMRAAVERHNDDGSVDLLVALRVKVSNSQAADQEQGYRLRVKMAPADGTFKVAALDQVTS